MTTPSLALSVFRLTLPPAVASELEGKDEAALRTVQNELNRVFHSRISAHSDKIFLTQTMLNDTFCVRFAVGAQRTRKQHVDAAWELIQENARGATEEWLQQRTNA